MATAHNTKQVTSPREDIRNHIHNMWGALSFDHEDLFLGGARNTLLPHRAGDPCYIYISDKEDLKTMREYYAGVKENLLAKLRSGERNDFKEEDLLKIEVRHFPRDENGKINIPPHEHGVLHIPARGISPGLDRYSKGTFYNWDSAFMIRGLIQDDKTDLAKDMLDNLLYEIEHYNGPLNANSTFCLSINDEGELDKPRSQLPLVASKILVLYHNWDRLKQPPQEDKLTWLKHALKLAEHHHGHWVSDPHYDAATGLSKFDTNHTRPGVEVLHAEPEHYRHAYDSLCEMFEKSASAKEQLEQRSYQARKDAYYAELYLERGEDGKPIPFSIDTKNGNVTGLSSAFFRGDWAMRESGFDPSRRFGFMNVDISNHLAVCLNCFRKKMEDDISSIYGLLEKEEPDVQAWREGKDKWRAITQNTKDAIQKYLWDDGAAQFDGDIPLNPEDPMYPSFRDLNINPLAEEYQIGRFRRYNFITTAVAPLWTGVATEEQAKQIIEKVLPLLEREHGLMTSTRKTGCQWDWEVTFSPNETMAAEGAEIYDYYYTALRLRTKRKETIEAEYERTGELWEKMEVIGGTSETSPHISAGVGYAENDRGFGWTIAEYIDSVHAIERLKQKIADAYVTAPCITSNFMVKAEGKARPAKDSHLATRAASAPTNTPSADY